jgi:A118 family predicted phage portal protein
VEVPGIGGALPSGIAVPLFSIARPGLTNSYDPFSPFGVSVFDDATGPVQVTDESIDNMHRDMWLGQKMVFLDERMLEKDVYGNVVVPRERDQQLFRKTEADSGNKLIEEYNPDLRVEDNRLALKTGLELLGARSGLGADYFSLDSEGGIKTATEVVADDSDLFRNLRKHQNAIAPAILAVVAGVYALARTVKGESLPESPGVLTVDFDDSVIEDTNAQRDRDRKDVAADLMQPWEYRVRWYGEDEATARAMAGGEGLPPEE